MPDLNKMLDVTLGWSPPQMNILINWLGLVVIFVVLCIGIPFIKWLMRKYHFRFNSIELSLPMGLNVAIERNEATMYIANRIHLELVTRKAALLFDPDNDNLLEVYNSLYVLFKTIREELKSIPGGYLKDYPSSHQLLELGIAILNNGLRPHLTQHQARYRAWHTNEQPNYPALSPQQLQKQYPDYQALIEDLQAVNRQISSWAVELERLLKND